MVHLTQSLFQRQYHGKSDILASIYDVWISTCCLEIDCSLLTSDKHFEMIEQIEAIFW